MKRNEKNLVTTLARYGYQVLSHKTGKPQLAAENGDTLFLQSATGTKVCNAFHSVYDVADWLFEHSNNKTLVAELR